MDVGPIIQNLYNITTYAHVISSQITKRRSNKLLNVIAMRTKDKIITDGAAGLDVTVLMMVLTTVT